jgi:hypothetical protein
MTTTESIPAIDRLLDPVARCLTPDALRELINLRADEELQERIESLAEKNTEGQLTAAERAEHETFVQTIQAISILQAKARKLLAARLAA